jgi:hypothetical protein
MLRLLLLLPDAADTLPLITLPAPCHAAPLFSLMPRRAAERADAADFAEC